MKIVEITFKNNQYHFPIFGLFRLRFWNFHFQFEFPIRFLESLECLSRRDPGLLAYKIKKEKKNPTSRKDLIFFTEGGAPAATTETPWDGNATGKALTKFDIY